MLTLILVALVALMIGGCLGMLVMAVCAAGARPMPPVVEEPGHDPCAVCRRILMDLATHQFLIRRWSGGFLLEWRKDGAPMYCGAERKWYGDMLQVVTPFPTFQGVEWYLAEWVIR